MELTTLIWVLGLVCVVYDVCTINDASWLKHSGGIIYGFLFTPVIHALPVILIVNELIPYDKTGCGHYGPLVFGSMAL